MMRILLDKGLVFICECFVSTMYFFFLDSSAINKFKIRDKYIYKYIFQQNSGYRTFYIIGNIIKIVRQSVTNIYIKKIYVDYKLGRFFEK